MTQNDENFCVWHLIFQEHISSDLHLWYTCMYKRIISPGIFFICFQHFDFWDHWGGRVKGQKMAQNDKKLCLSHSVSQELNVI